MKGVSWGAIFLIVLGLFTVLTPYSIFPVCQAAMPTASGGAVPMKCFWTARAAVGSGGMILFAGLLLLFVRTPGTRLGVALMLFAVGLFAILTPHTLIGVCPGEMMACHMGTLPALSLLGLLTLLAAAGVALRARKDMASTGKSPASRGGKRHTAAMRPDDEER